MTASVKVTHLAEIPSFPVILAKAGRESTSIDPSFPRKRESIVSTGCDLGNDETLTAATLADTFELLVLNLVADSGPELTAEELSLVDQWIEPSRRPQRPAQNAGA